MFIIPLNIILLFVKSICLSYASYLESKRYYYESSLLYERAGGLDTAVRMAEKAGAWQRAGNLARAAGWRAEQLTELWRSLAERLEEAGRGADSAAIWREWLQVGIDQKSCIQSI